MTGPVEPAAAGEVVWDMETVIAQAFDVPVSMVRGLAPCGPVEFLVDPRGAGEHDDDPLAVSGDVFEQLDNGEIRGVPPW